MKLRIRFEKKEALRFASHKDIVRAFQRCFAACKVPIAWSEGYHPHMKMSFGPPAKTGWASDEEYMDITVDDFVGANFAERCNDALPDGLRITYVRPLPERSAKLASDICAARMEIMVRGEDVVGANTAPDGLARFRDAIRARFGGDNNSPDAPRVLDVDIQADDDCIGITYTSTMNQGRIVAPTDVVETSLGDPSSFETPIRVARKAQYVERDGALLSPIDKGVFYTT